MGSSSSQPAANPIQSPSMDAVAPSQPPVAGRTPGLLPSVFHDRMEAPSASPATWSAAPAAPPPRAPPTRPARRSVYEIALSDDEEEGEGTTGGWPVSPVMGHAHHKPAHRSPVEVPDSQPPSEPVHVPATTATPVSKSAHRRSKTTRVKRRGTWGKHSRSTVREKEEPDGNGDTTMAASEPLVLSSSQIQSKPRKSAAAMPTPISSESDTMATTRRQPTSSGQRRPSANNRHSHPVEEMDSEQLPFPDRTIWAFRKTKPASKAPNPALDVEHGLDGIHDNAHNDNADGELSSSDAQPTVDTTSSEDVRESIIGQNEYNVEAEGMEAGDDESMDSEEDEVVNGEEEDGMDIEGDESIKEREDVDEDEDEDMDVMEDDDDMQHHNNTGEGSGSDESGDNDVLAKWRPSPEESRESDSTTQKDSVHKAPTPNTDVSEESESSSGEDEVPPKAPPGYQPPTRKLRSRIRRRISSSSEGSLKERSPSERSPSERSPSERSPSERSPSERSPSERSRSRTSHSEQSRGKYSRIKRSRSITLAERTLNNVQRLQNPPALRSTGLFTEDEDELIRRAICSYREKNQLSITALCEIIHAGIGELDDVREDFWKEIKTHGSTRNGKTVRIHVRALYHTCKTDVWTDEENEKLKELYNLYPCQWKLIGRALDRLPKNVRARYNYIHSNKYTKPWTNSDENRLVQAVAAVVQTDENDRAQRGEPPLCNYRTTNHNWTQVALNMGNTHDNHQCASKWRSLCERKPPPSIAINVHPRRSVGSAVHIQHIKVKKDFVPPWMGEAPGDEMIEVPDDKQTEAPKYQQTEAEPVQPRVSEELFQSAVSEEPASTGSLQPWLHQTQTPQPLVRPQMTDSATQADPVRPRMKDAETQAIPVRPHMKDAQTQTDPVLPQMKHAQTLKEADQARVNSDGEAATKCQCRCQCRAQSSLIQASVAIDEDETMKQPENREASVLIETPRSPQVEESPGWVLETEDEPAWIPQADEDPAWISQAEEEEAIVPTNVHTSGSWTPDSPQHEDDEASVNVTEVDLNSPEQSHGFELPQASEDEEDPATVMETTPDSPPRLRTSVEPETTLPGTWQETVDADHQADAEPSADAQPSAATEPGRDKRKKRRRSKKSVAAPTQSPQAQDGATTAAGPVITIRPAAAQMLWGDKYDLVEKLFAEDLESEDDIDWESVSASLTRPWPVETLQAALRKLFRSVEARRMVDDAAPYADYMFAVMDFLSKEHGSQLDEHYQSDAPVERTEREIFESTEPRKDKKKRKRERERTEKHRNSAQHSLGAGVKKQKRS